MAKFADVLTIINGRNQSKVENPNGQYPIYGSGGIMGYADDYLCEAGTVVIGRKGSINKPIYVDTPFWNVDTAFGLAARRDVLHPKYLYYFCVHFDFEKLNTTVTIPSLTKSNLLEIDIVLPSMSEQQTVVEQLDKVEALISLRKQQIAKLDELVKARFVEMFGDPATNPMNWSKITVMQAIEQGFIEKPLDGNHGGKHPKTSDYVSSGIPFIIANNLVDGSVDLNSCAFISKEQADSLDKGFAHDGDVLITHRGTIGRTAVLHCSYPYIMLTPQVTYYRPLNGMISEYLKAYFDSEYFQNIISSIASIGSTRAYIGITAQQELPLVIPALKVQHQFAAFIAQTNQQKSTIQQSLAQMELLKKALMQKYFG